RRTRRRARRDRYRAPAAAARPRAAGRRCRQASLAWPCPGQEFLHELAHLTLDIGWRRGGGEAPDTPGLRAHDLEIPAAHATVKGELLALEVIQSSPGDAANADRRIQIEKKREIGQHAARRLHVELADQLAIDTAPVPLIGDGGIGVTIAE